MNKFNFILKVFVYIVIICPVVWCGYSGDRTRLPRGVQEDHYHKEPPCASCPRHGKCVPMVQCPAHLRPGSYNPTCHLGNHLGVCCFTGFGHAAQHDLIARASSTISVEDVKASQHNSRRKISELMKKADEIRVNSVHTTLNITSPSFGHHLSMATYDKGAVKLIHGGLMNILAAQELKSRQAISDDELVYGFTQHTDGPFCMLAPTCHPNSRYRTIGGECNNIAYPTWGAANTNFEKLLPPDYSDAVWSMRTAKSGLPLPSPRLLSSTLLLDGSRPSMTHNLMFMQFGQFIAHDISASVVFTTGNGSAISCCTGTGTPLPADLQHFACAPITATLDDPFYGQFQQTCMNFVRAVVAPASDCSVGYAKQMNGASHFPDLSQLYGTSVEKYSSLRSQGGLLNTFNDYGRELPPLTDRNECITMKKGAACFDSGDNHGNQIISLTILHTIFTREHNRIAKALTSSNPSTDDDTVFYESRRILQALFQHIIYNEWLPLLLGQQIMEKFGLLPSVGYSTAYDPLVNPSLTSEFSTAAMRFGHSVVDGKMIVSSPAKGGIYEAISIPEIMFHPTRMRLRHFLDRMLIGLSLQAMQTVDPFVTEGLTRYMFHGGNPYGLDLASINIQRGRDHGVRSYNEYRRLIGLHPYTEFSDYPPSAAQRLSSVYERPEDIDLWIGGLLEEHVEGGIVGPVFANIIADQFARLKKGDRYFYEYGPDVNPGAFTQVACHVLLYCNNPEEYHGVVDCKIAKNQRSISAQDNPGDDNQLNEIKKVTISRIICDNSDAIELFRQPPEGFLRADLHGNEPVSCNSLKIPAIDLNKFKM